MKQILLITCFGLFSIAVFAQSEKFTNAMQEKIAVFDTTRNPDVLRDLANQFERIAQAEKTQWLPYYYAALAHLNIGYSLTAGQMGGMADKLDPVVDKVDDLVARAEALSTNNSEIFLLKKMSASLRMLGDPMNRFMTYGPKAQEALETARKLNGNNPRIYLLEGQDKYFTPEQYGGSREEAKKLFEEALKKFDIFQPESPLHPHWGKATVEYFLSQYNK